MEKQSVEGIAHLMPSRRAEGKHGRENEVLGWGYFWRRRVENGTKRK